jgi:glyoxylase-like metal-dependent hydrolase (beta-lactamase superfamily II)
MNREECMHVMASNINKLGIDLDHTDFFITHLHADHIGLVGSLVGKFSKIYLSNVDTSIIDWIYSDGHWEELFTIFRSNGFPEKSLKKALKANPGRRYPPKSGLSFSALDDGDSIEVGNFRFRCIATPGHSHGHMCLYDPENKVLFSGDYILFDITPSIAISLTTGDLLGKYLSGLKTVDMLDISIVLPGHRGVGSDYHKRIKELEIHHQNRLDETVHALEDGEKTAFQVAPYLSWQLDYSSWDRFPPLQKFFAVAETLAHLQYLESTGTVLRKTVDNYTVFYLSEKL